MHPPLVGVLGALGVNKRGLPINVGGNALHVLPAYFRLGMWLDGDVNALL